MSPIIILDSGPLGHLANPSRNDQAQKCQTWLQALLAVGRRVIIPEIADYEVRRELLRANRMKSIVKLNELAKRLEYLPLSTHSMQDAAAIWAAARQTGQPTAGDNTIDCDVILAAQALSLDVADILVATTNVGHLSRFVAAELWELIRP